jgi:hypothetical protein
MQDIRVILNRQMFHHLAVFLVPVCNNIMIAAF